MSVSGFLDVERVTVGYAGVPVLSEVSLSVNEGELVALLGSSGCGKTTLLRTIAGFAAPSSGAIRVAGRDITKLPPDRRDMALVFQSYALWPHMSVRENIGYGLKLRRVRPQAISAKVDEILAMLGLEGLGDRNVTAMSGGQRQRVALGRALAVDPRILLLDEPLSNLDARIRQSVRHEIRALQHRLGITAIHVTHDREEAMVMADRIVILNGGRIEQEGPPEQVYNAPSTPFVAKFMGAENAIELPAVISVGHVDIPAGPYNERARLPRRSGNAFPAANATREIRVTAFFRNEAAELLAEPSLDGGTMDENGIVLSGDVIQVSYPGGTWRHTIHVAGRAFYVDAPVRHPPSASVRIRLKPQAVFLFPAVFDSAVSEEGAESPRRAWVDHGSALQRGPASITG
jgi:ABC-type Fe3+/spermidine/putrescine transport system ATPase subunit